MQNTTVNMAACGLPCPILTYSCTQRTKNAIIFSEDFYGFASQIDIEHLDNDFNQP